MTAGSSIFGWRVLCAAIALLVCPNSALALEPVVVDQGTDRIVLGPYVEYLEDVEEKWSIEDVSSMAFSSRFIKTEEEVPNFGFTTTPHWIRLELKSSLRSKKKFLFEINFPVLDRIDAYFERTDGSFERITVGELFPYGNKVMRHQNFVFPIEIDAGQRQRIYLRVETQGVLQIPLSLWTPEAFLNHESEIQLFYGVFFGFLILMIFYNLFIFLVIRDRSYLYLVLFILSGCVVTGSHAGLAQQYLWPAFPWLANRALPLGLYALSVFIYLFTRRFLDIEKNLPAWKKTFSVMVALWSCGCVFSLFAPYNIAVILVSIIGVPALMVLLVVPIIAWRRGYKPARYYLMAWAAMLIAALVTLFNKLGILPRSTLTEHAYMNGSALSIVLFSFALADRINILRREKDLAQAQALDVQRQAAENLEREVERKTLDLQQAYDRLSEHDRLKSRFFANVSHELRTPLTLILTPLERLLSRDLAEDPESIRQQLRSMAGNTHRLLRLVNQLLDFSRLDSGAASVAFELRDIRAMVASLVHGFMPFARSKELKLELRVPDELPQAYVDPAKLDKTVSNLLSNACKFTESGGTVLVRISSDDQTVKIAIKDTGIGIAEKDLSKIFERFRQSDGSAARRYEGTGIGLSLSKELVELMGGTLEVNSDLGVGSTFTVSLPLGKDHIQDPSLIHDEIRDLDSVAHARAAATALAAERGLRRIADSATEEKVEQDASRALLLVVEDNPDMRALVAEICQEDFEVIEAENGRIGLEKIQQHHPALVVLDVMMPEMDGHEVLRRVRADPAIQSIPIIMLTAKAGPEMKLEGLESGADDYLSKPFESRELLARARNLVRLQQQERQLREINARLQQEVVEQSTALEQARALQRFLPPEVVRSVIEGGTPIQAGQQLRRLTCFRLELRGFDEMVEQAEPIVAPEDMATMLNAYLSEMMEVAFAHGATVDKFIRDTVVGFFGAPKSQGAEQDAVRCAKMAKKMWERAMEVCQRWQRFIDLPPPQPTLVLSSGHATVGNFGSSTRLEYTAMGGPVDETTALLDAVEPGSVACSQATWILIKDSVKGEPEGEVKLRGGSRSVKLYRIAGPHETVTRDPDATRTTMDRPSSFVARQPPQELCKGMVLAKRYEIVRPLGEGGMGTVYKARDLKLSSDVALKLLKHDMFSDDSRRARIYREVKLAQLVSHRNVARIYDLQAWEGFEFISMEFIQGQTLAERLQDSGALPTEGGCDVLRQICAGLAAAHAANIIHRDLKPSNIMLEEGGRVVIMDFGTAVWDSAMQETISKEAGVVGSPYYMAPEQFEDRQVDQRADIYALGVVAYEMFTGQVPFDAKNILSLAFKHTSQPPPDPLSVRPDLSMRLSAVILRCLEKSPAKRFGSAVEVAALL